MIKFSEFVSLGHPDKIEDYIPQYILDRYIEKDPLTRYAVEEQINDYRVTIGGEVSSNHHFSTEGVMQLDPQKVWEKFKLNTPIYASMCRWGLFGEYQQDKTWE